MLQTIQRTAAETTIENTVSVFNLASDDQKGQIIDKTMPIHVSNAKKR